MLNSNACQLFHMFVQRSAPLPIINIEENVFEESITITTPDFAATCVFEMSSPLKKKSHRFPSLLIALS